MTQHPLPPFTMLTPAVHRPHIDAPTYFLHSPTLSASITTLQSGERGKRPMCLTLPLFLHLLSRSQGVVPALFAGAVVVVNMAPPAGWKGVDDVVALLFGSTCRMLPPKREKLENTQKPPNTVPKTAGSLAKFPKTVVLTLKIFN